MSSVAIGIDLGTTYSCVGVYENGNVTIIANDQGNRTTPSYVAFTDEERMVGESAKNQVSMNPKNTIFDVKRLIGRRYDEHTVQNDKKYFSFDVVDENNKPMVEITREEKRQRYSPGKSIGNGITENEINRGVISRTRSKESSNYRSCLFQ